MGRKKKKNKKEGDYFDISGQAFIAGPNMVQAVSQKSLSLVTNQVYPGLGLIALSVLGRADYDNDPKMGNQLKLTDVIVSGMDMPGMASNPLAMANLHMPNVATVRVVRNKSDYGNDIETVKNTVEKLRNNKKAPFPVYQYDAIKKSESEVKLTKALMDRYLTFFGDVKGGDPVYAHDAANKKWVPVADPVSIVKGFGFMLDNIGQLLMYTDYMDYLDANLENGLVDMLESKGGKSNPDIGWFDLVSSGTQFGLNDNIIEALVDDWYTAAAGRSIVNLTKADIRIWVRFKYYYLSKTFHLFNAAIDSMHIDTHTYDIKNETKDKDVSWLFGNKIWSVCKSIRDSVLRDADGELHNTELMLAVWSWYRRLAQAHESGLEHV